MRNIFNRWSILLCVACGGMIVTALVEDACDTVASAGAQGAVPVTDASLTERDRTRQSLRTQLRDRAAHHAAAELTMPAKAALGAITEFFQAAATKMAETPLAQVAPEPARAIRQQTTTPSSLAQSEHISPQPAPAKNAEPVKLPAAPKVAIAGPERGTPGAMPVFTANVVGRYDALKWAVTPSCEGLLILADPRQCTFGNDEPGEYTIRCTVSGGRQIAECECVYQIVAVGQSPALIEGVPKLARNQLPVLQNSPPNNLSERVIEQINKVQIAARAPEAHALGACFRDAANRFDTGQVAPDADIAVEVFRCAKAGLGDPTVARWKPFFEWTALELAMLRQAGLSPSGFLNQVAIVMSQVQ